MADSAAPSTSEFGWLIEMIKHIVGQSGGVVVPPTVSDQPKSAKAEATAKKEAPAQQQSAAPVAPAAQASIQPLANVVQSVLPLLSMNPLASTPTLPNLIGPQQKRADASGAHGSAIGKDINSWITKGVDSATSEVGKAVEGAASSAASGASDIISSIASFLGL